MVRDLVKMEKQIEQYKKSERKKFLKSKSKKSSKILRKPKAKIQGASALKALKALAASQGGLVKDEMETEMQREKISWI